MLYEVITIHGDKDRGQRSVVMKNFKTGANKVLITTDVSARGIDIPNVEIVVNYDIPEEAETYVHRVGRTGRANNKGMAVSFCSESEKELLQVIEDYLDKPVNRIEIEKKEYKRNNFV